MKDVMLTELYMRVFQKKNQIKATNPEGSDDRLRQVYMAEHKLLCELLEIRMDQLFSIGGQQ